MQVHDVDVAAARRMFGGYGLFALAIFAGTPPGR